SARPGTLRAEGSVVQRNRRVAFLLGGALRRRRCAARDVALHADHPDRLIRSSSVAFAAGQSSSITAYHAESRRSPPRTSMCLRATPSNLAPTFSSAGRERSFEASVLNSTRR